MTDMYDDVLGELETPDQAAARAARAWLIAEGLDRAFDVAAGFDDKPIAMPGRRELRQRAHDAIHEACEAADAAGSSGATDVGGAADVVAAADVVEQCARLLAQLLLGVTSQAPPSDGVYALERAAVAVLCPPFDESGGATLSFDSVTLQARDLAGLRTELAGIICRLLLDWGSAVRLAGADGTTTVTLVVDETATLRVAVEVPGADGARVAGLEGAGFVAQGDDTWTAEWPSPVTVQEPVTVVIGELAGVPTSCEVTERFSRKPMPT